MDSVLKATRVFLALVVALALAPTLPVFALDCIDDSAYVDVNTTTAIDVLVNDDPQEVIGPLTISDVSNPSHGTATIETTPGPDGDYYYVQYTPDTDYTGSDSFTYTVPEGTGDTATVFVTVGGLIANDDSASTMENARVEVLVLGNDVGSGLSIDSVTQASHGTVAIHGSRVIYTPDYYYTGPDSFTYTATDGSQSDTATVNVTVDPSLSDGLYDDDVEVAADTETCIDVLANDDAGWDVWGIGITPSHGTAYVPESHDQVCYTPDPGYTGSDRLAYGGMEGFEMDTAVVTLTVSGSVPANAVDDSAVTDENSAATIDVLANDAGEGLTIDSVAQPSYGAVTNNGTDVTYTPNAGYYGPDSFTYTISDDDGNTDTATVDVTVNSLVVRDDYADIPANTTTCIDVLANDDPGTTLWMIDHFNEPDHGTAVVSSDQICYTPDMDYTGLDDFAYWDQETNAADVYVTVIGTPDAQDDAASTDEDTAVVIDVLANDDDPDGDTLSVDSVTQAPHGTVTNNGTDVTYTPDADYHGTDSFTYTVIDDDDHTDTATVDVTVNAVNDDPVAVDDSTTAIEDVPYTIDVLDNDSDVDGDTLAVDSVTQPSHGTVTNNGTDVTYTSDNDYTGPDSFTYTAADGHSGYDTATVNVTVNATNDDPVAADDSIMTDEDTAATIDVLDNDSDVDGDTLAVDSVTQPAHGAVTNNGTDVTYTPDADYHGADSFTYTASDDHGGFDTAMVNVTVNAVNDDPVAAGDAAITDEDAVVTITVLDNDADVDGDTLSVDSVIQPTHGTVTNNGTDVIYTPDADYHGPDSFTYTAADGHGGFDTAVVNVTVDAVNDRPVAMDDSATTEYETAIVIDVLINDADVDGDTLSVDSVTQASHGTVTTNGTDVTYTPTIGYHGADNFTYTAADGHGGFDTATVDVTVNLAQVPPDAADDFPTTDEDVAVTIDVLANDTDLNGDALTVTAITDPLAGTVSGGICLGGDQDPPGCENGVITYTPGADDYGGDSFGYTISDGRGGTDEAQVEVTIHPVNDSPVALDDEETIEEDIGDIFPYLLNNDDDVDGDPLSIVGVGAAEHGSVTVEENNSVAYDPEWNYYGTDAFTYTASDGYGGTSVATVTVYIAPRNDPLFANDDFATTEEDTPAVVIDVLANDADADDDPKTIVSIGPAAHGTPVSATTVVTYTPAPDFNGTDAFTYTVRCGPDSDTAVVTVTVAPTNDAPMPENDEAVTDEDTPVVIDVLHNDVDIDGDTLTVASVTQPAHGTATNNGGVDVTYTPDPDYHGADTFYYVASDGALTGTTTVSVDVTPVNDAPVAQDDQVDVDEGTSKTFHNLLDNDGDVDGHPLTIVAVGDAEHGDTGLPEGGGVSYRSDVGFSGLDYFTYTVGDGLGGMDTARVTVTVHQAPCVPVSGVDFSWTPSLPAAGQIVTFTASSSPVSATQPMTYVWSIGGEGLPIYHTFVDTGTYPVVVTATNACSGPVTATHAVVVTGTPFVPVYGVSLTPSSIGDVGMPGTDVTYSLWAINTGNAADTFDVRVEGNRWPTTVTPQTINLLPSSTQPVTVTVSVPGGALSGASDAATVMVDSRNGDVTDASVLSTTVGTYRRVALAPVSATGSGGPGDVVAYTLWLTNASNFADTFALEIDGNAWTTYLSITETEEMPAGQSVEVGVSVVIPALVDDGETDVVTLTAHSSASGVSTTAVLTTVAAVGCVNVTSVTLAADADRIEASMPVRFHVSIGSGNATPPYHYRYFVDDVPDAIAVSGDNPSVFTHTFESAGIYDVSVAVWNCEMVEGQAVEGVTQVEVAGPDTCEPLNGIAIGSPTTGHTGERLTFTAHATPANATAPITYTWNPTPTVEGQGTPTATYRWTATGTHAITLTVTNCGGTPVSDTHTATIAVAPPTVVYLPLVARNFSTGPATHLLDDAPDACVNGHAVVLGDRYRDDFDHENDNDWYTFEATAGQPYRMWTFDLASESDTSIALYAADCETKLAENDDVDWPDDVSSRLNWTAPEDGAYCVQVRHYDWRVYGEETGYTFSILPTPPHTSHSGNEEVETPDDDPSPPPKPVPRPGANRPPGKASLKRQKPTPPATPDKPPSPATPVLSATVTPSPTPGSAGASTSSASKSGDRERETPSPLLPQTGAVVSKATKAPTARYEAIACPGAEADENWKIVAKAFLPFAVIILFSLACLAYSVIRRKRGRLV